jgi:hypothetical protein
MNMAKITLKRNDVIDYEQDYIHKIYEGVPGYTMKGYRELEFEYVPLDLSKYPSIEKETAKWIDKLFTQEDEDRNGNYMLRGFTGSDNYRLMFAEMEKLGITDYHTPSAYALYGFNTKEMLIYTWTEGDTTLTLFNNRAEFEKEKAATIAWYKEEY